MTSIKTLIRNLKNQIRAIKLTTLEESLNELQIESNLKIYNTTLPEDGQAKIP
jgi:hypothetical protein